MAIVSMALLTFKTKNPGIRCDNLERNIHGREIQKKNSVRRETNIYFSVENLQSHEKWGLV